MAIVTLRYDFRSHPDGPDMASLYEAGLEQCVYADTKGVTALVLSEHHGSADGYLPSPLVFAAAIAARTTNTPISISALVLTLHDPIRAAEDTLVLDHLSRGRVSVCLGGGYVPEEFAMFGIDLEGRGRVIDEKVAAYVTALTGEPVTYRGSTFRVTPEPFTKPRPFVLMGGAVTAAALRAARYCDGFLPMVDADEVCDAYVAECERLGKAPGMTMRPGKSPVTFVVEDPEAAWEQFGPHLLLEFNGYARWAAELGTPSPYSSDEANADGSVDLDGLKRSGKFLLVTPDEAIEQARAEGPFASFLLQPLTGGLPIDLSWESLRLMCEKVMPALA